MRIYLPDVMEKIMSDYVNLSLAEFEEHFKEEAKLNKAILENLKKVKVKGYNDGKS